MQRCPSCNEENPDRFRICGFCGTPLQAAPPPEEVRKTVTIVFCDLKGSTSLGERLDSEALREVLAVYFAAMKQVLERHGGTVEKYIGDAIMAVFGLPRMHEDDALRAVRAAFEMRQALAEVNVELRATWGVELENRTGVNTGEVVAGDAATGQRLATGDTVNVAARLEQAAPASEVLVGESTYRLVRDAVEVRAVEPLELKGKSERVPAYQLLSVTEGEGIRRRVDLPMVGRREELATALELFATSVSERRCQMLTVVGHAGLGKSRLVEEILRSIGGEARVLRGRCLSYGEGATFYPLVEIVRQAAGITHDDDDGAARTKLHDVLGAELGDAADRLASVMGLSATSYGKEELFWAARALFDHVARSQPLVVVFDDIHWAEPTFLDLIAQVADTSSGAALLLVCAARHELFEERPGWGDGMANARRIELSELSSADSTLVVKNLLGDARLPQPLEAKILSVAGGNPLFVEQMLSMLVDEGVLRAEAEGGGLVFAGSSEEVAVPDSISALLASRLDRLGPRELGVLTRASIVGLEFERSDLYALAPDEDRDVVPSALAALGTKRLVRERRNGDRGSSAGASPRDGGGLADLLTQLDASYEFAHILVRNAAYERLLKRNRSGLHQRFADELIRRSGTRIAEIEGIVGYHLEQAYRNLVELGPLSEDGRVLGRRAAGHLASAGRRAFASGDMPAAASLLRRAADLLDQEDTLRPRLLLDAGDALVEIGELEAAKSAFTQARDAALLLGDARLARASRLAELQLRYTHEPETGGDGVRDEVEAMMPALEADADDFALARAFALLTYIHLMFSRNGAVAETAVRAIRHAEAAGDDVLARRLLGALAMAALNGPTPVGEAVRICESVLERAQDHRKAAALAEVALGHLEAMRGNFARARTLYRHSRAILEEFGWRLFAALTSIDSGDIEMLAGDPDAAEAELRRDYRSLEEMGERNYISTIAGLLGDVLYRKGDLAEAAQFAGLCEELAAADDVPSNFHWRSIRARLAAREGAFEEGGRLMAEGLEILSGSDMVDLQGRALVDLAEVQVMSGDGEGARRSLGAAVERFRDKGDAVMAERALALAGALGAPPAGGFGEGPGEAARSGPRSPDGTLARATSAPPSVAGA